MIERGMRVGPYEVIEPIGAGGMGEVYRARDTKLARDVALKILPDVFASDPDRLARFQREAQVLASLNHPHIAQIYGFEEHALALEFVDGPTLADRIAQGGLPLDEALPIALQIADALEAAHAQGIIHRDLKPANIKLRPDGTVKVLDFGLAKALDPTASDARAASPSISPTLTAATQLGMILGTAAYMSPEQAKGKPVDKRADNWAFGCVLYEMLTGKRAFPGDDITEVLAFVITKEPDWSALPPSIPPALRRLLRHCLQKDRKRRLADIADARFEIEEARAQPPDATADAVMKQRSRWHAVAPWLIAASALIALLVALAIWQPWRRPADAVPLRFAIALGADATLSMDPGNAIALSPDGRLLAFTAFGTETAAASAESRRLPTPYLYVRRLDQLQATVVPDTANASAPFFSPDGAWLAFFADGKLKKVAADGGAVVTICDAASGRGGTWGEDGTIVFAPVPNKADEGVRLLRLPPAGGSPQPVSTLMPGDVTHRWPQLLAGGSAVLYTSHRQAVNFDSARLVIERLPNGPAKVVQENAYYGRYVASGHIVFVREGTLFAAPFDPDRLEVTGAAVPVVDSIGALARSGAAHVAVSAGGTLAFVVARESGSGTPIHWITRRGEPTPLRSDRANWTNIAFSPDGAHLAFNIADATQGDLWVYDIARGVLSKMASDRANHIKPVWTPDGRHLAFAADRDGRRGIFLQAADPMRVAHRLTTGPHLPGSWHPSGKFLAVTTSQGGEFALLAIPVEGDDRAGWRAGTPQVLTTSSVRMGEPMFSPDGRWFAYQSGESSRGEIFVQPFQADGRKVQISIAGGLWPTWSKSRREIVYLADGRLMVVPYSIDGDVFRPERARPWSPTELVPRGIARPFDLHPDGERVAGGILLTAQAQETNSVVFALNWFDELNRRVPHPR